MNPSGEYQINERTVSNGDHSFTALYDGKYAYCFGNQHWVANTKEVSFNVHGIVYVTESESSADPLEAEGTWAILLFKSLPPILIHTTNMTI